MDFWQHDETGRLYRGSESPGAGWSPIIDPPTEEQQEADKKNCVSPTWRAFLDWHLSDGILLPEEVTASEAEMAAFHAWQAGMDYVLSDLLPAFKEVCAWAENPPTGGMSRAVLNRKLLDWLALIESFS